MRSSNKVILAGGAAVAMLLSVATLSMAELSNAGPELPMLRAVLYAPACTVSKGDTVDLVIEVSNNGKHALEVGNLVQLERMVKSAKGVNRAPRQVDNLDPQGPEQHLKILCYVPDGYKEKLIAPRGINGTTPHRREVEANESIFLKVALPIDAFEVGTCSFSVMTFDGVVYSNTLMIECVAKQK